MHLSATRKNVPALAAIAMIAFAGNSILCRVALETGDIDAVSFTTLRLVSGAIMLSLLVLAKLPAGGGDAAKPGLRNLFGRKGWGTAIALFVYAAGFSYAYIALGAGMGALILFAAVQITMIGAGVWQGERLGRTDWLGIFLASGGLVYLLLPGVHGPPLTAALLMAVAGIAWGVYSLMGRGVSNPTLNTAVNFLRAVPFTLALSILSFADLGLNFRGALLAVASGALTSGLGYVIWYAALRNLTAVQASVLQLTVPPLAALGGVLLLGEQLGMRLVLSSLLILGGVALTIRPRPRA